MDFSSLHKNGYMIVPSVLDPTEQQELINGLWEHTELVTGKKVIRNDMTTWNAIKMLTPSHGMLMQHYHYGQCQATWNVRQNPKVVNVFQELYKTPNLLTSMDGVSFGLPSEFSRIGWHNDGRKWFHIDQALANNKFSGVQGWVSANEVLPGDATLSVLEQSHMLHESFASEFGQQQNKTDWFKLTDIQVQWYKNKGCREIEITCPAGSLVLWDSRTVHYGKGPTKGRRQASTRYVVYVCMAPKQECSNTILKKRMKLFNEGRMTTHWPLKAKTFPKYPNTYGKKNHPIYNFCPPILSDLGKSLIA